MKMIIIISLVLMSIILIPRLAIGNVLISQVYYDPITNQNGGEAIELYNPTDEIIEISNYVLKTRSSTTTIPDDTYIMPKSYFLVGDKDFHILKDNPYWLEADYQNTISLANTNAGVALMFNDSIIDAIGWGNKNNLDDYLYLGEPASQVPKSYSLLRINDTKNNSNDFVKFETWFRNSVIVNETIDLRIEYVSDEAITNDIIKNISFETDDLPKQDIQIIPTPDKDKDVIIKVFIEEINLTQINALFNDKNFSFEKIENYYLTKIKVPYYYSPGKHNITIIAEANDLIEERKIEFEIMPIIAITSSKETLSCNKQNCTFIDNAPIIKNIGNLPLSILLENHGEAFIKYGTEIDEWNEINFREKVFELNPKQEIKINFYVEPKNNVSIVKIRAGMK